jgi:hypothetical protein
MNQRDFHSNQLTRLGNNIVGQEQGGIKQMRGFANCRRRGTGSFGAHQRKEVNSHSKDHNIQQKNRVANFIRDSAPEFSSGGTLSIHSADGMQNCQIAHL